MDAFLGNVCHHRPCEEKTPLVQGGRNNDMPTVLIRKMTDKIQHAVLKPESENKFLNLRWDYLISLFIVLAALLVYWQVRNHEFISLDDGLYVTENHQVQSGFSVKSIHWAFRFKDITYWHPLTWLSHMLDCQLFGLNSGMHHLMNLMLHLANSTLLFFVFKKMTGDRWKSGFIAVLFALHPMNAESVAWVAERKNVLSTLFWMLSLLGYSLYAARPRLSRWLLTLFIFTLGLMSKPAIVTLPFVFLLLDYWPLKRCRAASFMRADRGSFRDDFLNCMKESNISWLILEKIPFFTLSAVSIYISYLSTQHHGIVVSTYEIPIYLRLANGLVSYMSYLGKMIWPQNLAVFYPYPEAIPLWLLMIAVLWLTCVSIMVIRWLPPMPYLAVGWFWYLGTLVPSIGFMQAGLWPAMADRWAYIPFIGLFIMSAWGMPQIMLNWRQRRLVLSIAGAGIIAVFMLLTWNQVGYWKNSIALYQHAVQVTARNDVAHNNLGVAYSQNGKVNEAIVHFIEALRILPGYKAAHTNLLKALTANGSDDRLVEKMHRLIELYPDITALQYSLANIYRTKGQLDKAIEHYQIVLTKQPDFVQALNNMAVAYAIQGKYSEAISLFMKVVELRPNDASVYYDIAILYARLHQAENTMTWLKQSVARGFRNLDRIKTDKNFKLVRDTPEYKQLFIQN